MYRLIVLPPAARFLKKIKEKPLKNLFQKAIDHILLDPLIGDAKTGDLSGVFCIDIYHGKTNYEIAYMLIEKPEETVIVLLAGSRENFYDQLKRYIY